MTARFKALLWVLVTFLLGALLGGASVHLWSGLHHHWGHGFQMSHRENSERARERVFERLSRKLELESNQKERLRRILQDGMEEYDQARKNRRQEFRSIRNRMRQEIRGLLHTQQLKKFDDFIYRRDQKRKRRD